MKKVKEWIFTKEEVSTLPCVAISVGGTKRKLEGEVLFNYWKSGYLNNEVCRDLIRKSKVSKSILDFFEALYKGLEKRIGNKREYSRYINSNKWKKTRKRILEQRGYKCEECGTEKEGLHVHHLTYENIGEEKDEDLKVLCKTCHQKVHGKEVDVS